jgi:hypothetical protein
LQDLDFGVSVLATIDGTQQTSIGIITRANTSFMPDWDVAGWDYLSVPSIANPLDCQHACDQDRKCQAWAFAKTRQVNNNCFLKTGIPALKADPTIISGVKQQERNRTQLVWVYINRARSQYNPAAARDFLAGTAWMAPTDWSNNQWSLELDVFIDRSVIEVFEPQGGRVAITTRVYPEEESADKLAVYVNIVPSTPDNITITTLDTWSLEGLWTSL